MKTLRDRDLWQAAVLADHVLGSGDKCLLVRISLHHNFKTGRCNPAYQTLADGTGMKLAAIPKQLKRGEERGYIRRVGTKGRHSNSYEMLMPTLDSYPRLTANDGTGSTADSNTRFERSNPTQPSDSTAYKPEIEPPTAIHTNKEVILNSEKNTEGYLFPALPSVVPDSTTTDFFKHFYAAYPRKKAPGDAEVALGQVLKKKQATEAEIMAGVDRLVQHFARRPKTDRIYIPYPAKWLRDRAWADELDEPRPSRATTQTDELNASVSTLQRWAEQ